MKGQRKITLGALFALALATAAFAFLPRRSDALNFAITDLWTGKPINTGTIQVAQRWVRLPMPRFLSGIIPLRSQTIPITGARVKIDGIPAWDSSAYILINVPGYESALITQHSTSVGSYPNYYVVLHKAVGTNLVRESPYQYLKKDQSFTIALEPINRSEIPEGIYEPDPPPGSREKAIAGLQRYRAEHGAKPRPPDRLAYVNGYWEISFFHHSLTTGGDVTSYHVSSDGDVLNVFTGE